VSVSRAESDVGGSRSASALGFLVLAVGVAAWWGLILHVPPSRLWFFPGGVIEHPLRAFVMPDLLVLSVGSAVAAWLIATGRPGAIAASWFVAGAAGYATVYTISWSLHEDVPLASPLLMTAAAALAIVCARAAVPRSR
jgi:hypothetical protein